MSVLVTHDHLRVLFLYVTLRLGTLDATSVVEWLTPETNISHQVYRRVWPTTQREALFWSTIQHHPSDDDEGPDYWIVVNHSTEHEHVPVRTLFLDSSSLVFSCTSALLFMFIIIDRLQNGSLKTQCCYDLSNNRQSARECSAHAREYHVQDPIFGQWYVRRLVKCNKQS